MTRFRTSLGLLLGLLLLLQGLAVSAAPRARLSGEAPAPVSAMANLPCHAQAAMPSHTTDQQDHACCDASCPDMTHCALGHLASFAPLSLSLPRIAGTAHADSPVRLASRSLNSPLRPPIARHG